MYQNNVSDKQVFMENLRTNLREAKRDFSAFLTLWKYIQRKERQQKISNGKIN
jgi:hypothetical protein